MGNMHQQCGLVGQVEPQKLDMKVIVDKYDVAKNGALNCMEALPYAKSDFKFVVPTESTDMSVCRRCTCITWEKVMDGELRAE